MGSELVSVVGDANGELLVSSWWSSGSRGIPLVADKGAMEAVKHPRDSLLPIYASGDWAVSNSSLVKVALPRAARRFEAT